MPISTSLAMAARRLFAHGSPCVVTRADGSTVAAAVHVSRDVVLDGDIENQPRTVDLAWFEAALYVPVRGESFTVDGVRFVVVGALDQGDAYKTAVQIKAAYA